MTRAVQLSRFGGPEVLELVERPKPSPQAGQVLIRIEAAGVNFFETLMRQDRYAVTPDLPLIFGVEVAGIIEEVGAAVEIRPGRRVAVPLFAFGRPGGGYADYIAVDAKAAVDVPDALPFETAVALMVQGLTALHATRRGEPKDKTVLVTAAAGGVGSLLVQLARQAGARRVIAAAGTEPKLDLARALGADDGVNYMDAGWADAVQADVIYDFVGGKLTETCLMALAPKGELLFGALGRAELGKHALESLFARNQSLKGFALLPLLAEDEVKADLAQLFNLVLSGGLKILEPQCFSLDQASAAHRLIDQRLSTGKVVLLPSRGCASSAGRRSPPGARRK
jgi:NADPH2:quinone reductase